MNVYVILAWYSDASRKDDYRITHQRLENAYVCQKIEEIVHYRMDAHHWNRDHFERDFVFVYEQALQSYEEIAQKLGVAMHSQEGLRKFLDEVRSSDDRAKLDLKKYAELSLSTSERAALREVVTAHRLEHSQIGSAKGFFEIRNYLGGIYYLTADEIIFESDERVVIQESKNSTKHSLPSLNDIKDGLFKLLLFSQLSELRMGDTRLQFTPRLRLTGKFLGRLLLPAEDATVQQFARSLGGRNAQEKLEWLNKELHLLRIEGILEGSND